jgi:anion transporter
MPTEEKKSGIDYWRRQIGMPLTVVAFAAILMMPTPDGLTVMGQKALAVLAGLVILYLTEPVELTVASIMVIPAAVFLGLANVKQVLANFATSSIFLLVGAILMAAAMEKTGLAERFTYWLLSTIGCSARNITLGVMTANIALAFMVPSTTARTAILLPICLSILTLYNKANGIEGRSRFAIGLLLTLAFTNSTISGGILTATTPNPITVDFIQRAGGVTISYIDWLIYGFPPAMVMTLLTWWYLRRAYKPEHEEIPGGIDYIRERLAAMGSITGAEWRTLSVFVLVVALWATGGWTKIDTTVACFLGASLLFIPKFGVITWKDTNRDSAYHILMVSGGALAMGEFLLKTGAAKWLALKVFNSLGLVGASSFVIIAVVMLIVQYARIGFFGTTGLTVLFMPVVVAFAAAANLPAAALALPVGMLIGSFPFLMFYNTLSNILVFGTGYLVVGDFPKVGFVLCFAGVLVYTLFAATYWHWLGLF